MNKLLGVVMGAALAATIVIRSRRPHSPQSSASSLTRPSPSTSEHAHGGLAVDPIHPPLATTSRNRTGSRLVTASVIVAAIVLTRTRQRRGEWLVFAGAALVTAYRPLAGMIVWVAVSGTFMLMLSKEITFSAAHLVLLLGVYATSGDLRRLRGSRMRHPLFALSLVAALSCLGGIFLHDPSVLRRRHRLTVQLVATALVELSVATAFMFATQLKHRRALYLVRRALLSGAGTLLIAARIPALRALRPGWWPLPVSHAAAQIYARILFDPTQSRWAKWLGRGAIGAAIFEVVAIHLMRPQHAQKISDWLGISVALLGVAWFRSSRAFFTAAGLVAAIGIAARGQIKQALAVAYIKHDFDRLIIWQDALKLAARRPLFGTGPGNYPEYAIRYAQGYLDAPDPLPVMMSTFSSAHGTFPQIAAEMGLAGVATTSWIFIRTIRLGHDLVMRVDDPVLRSVAVGATASIAGQLVAGIFGDFLIPCYQNDGKRNLSTTLYTWMLIGALMGIEDMCNSPTTETA